jgi:hypothetical protein
MNDDEDMGDMWREFKRQGQEKRGKNRETSPAMLKAAGIEFEEKNGGAHLVVRHNGHTVDFWPGTGKWITRGGRFTVKSRGVKKLIEHVQSEENK